MNAIPPLFNCTPEETEAEQRQRMRAYTVELAEINMQAARVAGQRIAKQHLDGTADETRPSTDPNLALSRATRGVAIAINTELGFTRPRAAAAPPRAPSTDRRRAPLRAALMPAALLEPDPPTRKALQRQIDEHIEAALLADPDAEIPIEHIFAHVIDTLGLTIDLSKVSDEVLGMPPRNLSPPRPPGPEPPYR